MGVGSWLALQSFGLVVLGKRNLAHELNGKKITKVKEQKDVKRLGGFSSHHGIKLARGPEHMAGERESSFFQRERAFKGEREHFQEREEFKKGIQESEEKYVLGI